jgi:hypothetical protein
MNQKAIVSIGKLAVLLWFFLGALLIIPWYVVGVLVPISIGIPTLLLAYEKGKSNISVSQAKPEKKHGEKENIPPTPLIEEEKTTSSLLPDINEIIKLKIDDKFLDQIYEEARSKAVNEYADAQLSYFAVQAFPFNKLPSVNIYFDFYSKWANKTCNFQYSDLTSKLRHFTPNKRAKSDLYKGIFSDLPWKTSPHFPKALSKTYDKISS